MAMLDYRGVSEYAGQGPVREALVPVRRSSAMESRVFRALRPDFAVLVSAILFAPFFQRSQDLCLTQIPQHRLLSRRARFPYYRDLGRLGSVDPKGVVSWRINKALTQNIMHKRKETASGRYLSLAAVADRARGSVNRSVCLLSNTDFSKVYFREDQ